AGACNQISAAPSAIRAVVDKIQSLMQTARGHSEQCFKYALNVVAGNLTKQARVVLDYKSLLSTGVRHQDGVRADPELSDVLLAYFNQMSHVHGPRVAQEARRPKRQGVQDEHRFEEAVDAQDGKKKADSDRPRTRRRVLATHEHDLRGARSSDADRRHGTPRRQ
ncbi:hypothetical protein PINS_up022410, partial [Pythium insidiosum]